MRQAIHNKVKVYNLTAGKSLPEWLADRKKNKKLAGGERRILAMGGESCVGREDCKEGATDGVRDTLVHMRVLTPRDANQV